MRKFRIHGLFIILVLLFLPSRINAEEVRNIREDNIRVAVIKDAEKISFSVRGRYKIIDIRDGFVVDEGRRLSDAEAYPTPDGIVIGEYEYLTDHIAIQTQKDVTVQFKTSKGVFRNQIDIVKDKKGKLIILNVLSIEDYIQGVLYHEVPHRWPMEALKAQAVAARTYALYRMKNNADLLYDVTSDIYSQVYGGKDAERYRTNLAVKRTRGEVLIFSKAVLPAYYHSNSGGHTEDVSELWKEDLAPLKGVADKFAVGAPHYTWRKNYRSSEIQEKLNNNGFSVGLIKDISVVERNASGRIRTLKITDRNGKVLTVSGKKFRQIVGPNDLKSNNYEVVMKGYYFDLIGKGWGHGVGMCQWGAYKMSRELYGYDEILNFYYPGAEIKEMQDEEERIFIVDVDELRRLRKEGKL